MTFEHSELHGFSLFTEVEDAEIRTYNRARVMKNIMLDHSDAQKNVHAAGRTLLMAYFSKIPAEDRKATYAKLEELLVQKEVE